MGKRTLLLFFVAVLLTVGAPAVRGQSALDGFDPNANGQVRAVVVQPDGKILVGGYFTVIVGAERKYIARLNPDGTLDMDFNPEANGPVLSIARQADGQVLAGGFFGIIGGLPRNFIARLDATTGVADPFFDPNPEAFVSAIAVQTDGQILVGGFFTSFTPNRMGLPVPRNYIARLDSTGPTVGKPDSFDPNPDAFVTSIVATPGRILLGGFFTSFTRNGGQPVIRNHIARLYPNGKVESGFNPNALGGIVSAIAIQADGQVLIGGSFRMLSPPNGPTFARNRVARVDATFGFADPSFDPNADGGVGSIAVQPDGKILMGGGFTTLSPPGGPQITLRRIARLKPDGTPELSFNPNVPNTNDYVYSIAVQQDGKILAGGSFSTIEPDLGLGDTRHNIARLETDGRLDRALNLVLDRFAVFATAVQPDGKILIGGDFHTVFGVRHNNIARLNTDGALDLDFNPNPNNSVSAIAVQADGQILVGGFFSTLEPTNGVDQPVTRNNVARLNPNGTLDLPFNPNADRPVLSIGVQADGQILLGGAFSTLEPTNGMDPPVTRNYIARLNPDGTLDLAHDPPFNPNPNGLVYSIAVQADGQILVGGFFISIGLQRRNHIARLDGTTGEADSFNPYADSKVHSIVVQADGKILIAGDFFILGLFKRYNHIARLEPGGMVDLPFNPNPNHFVSSMAVQADGQILVCGGFTTLEPTNGIDPPVSRNGIARLKPDGTLDFPFNPNALGGGVIAIALQADGKILAGGEFTAIGGQTRSLFARLSNGTPALQNLDVTRSDTALNTITWTRGGSSPELTRATFELSTNGGATYTFLGHGVRVGTTSNFTLTGLILPAAQNFWIRARGYYRSGQFNGSESITESVRNAIIPRTSIGIDDDIKNFSTRFRVQTGNNVGIGGFIVAGTEPKHVLIRAIGPSLAQFGVPNALADPVLELHGPDAFATMTNNNWRDRQEAGILASGIPPTNDLESAIDATLDPGAYTAVVSGNGNTSGVALVEVYDLDQEVDSKLANISTRAVVGTGDDVVIAGFILGDGNGDNHRIVVRGIGPSLTAFGVPNALANPTLELRDSNGTLLLANNDWQDDPAQAAELTAAGLAPTNNLESGIAATLSPGSYTALLAGRNNGTGVGLVEVYDHGAL
jgi:uncharacterized delta-60 repeat protein